MLSRADALTTLTILNGLHGDRNVDEVCVALLRVAIVPVRLNYDCRAARVTAGGGGALSLTTVNTVSRRVQMFSSFLLMLIAS